ncbi:MAG: hypothetical protein CM15mP120_15690 [Pseudomonadota bacterium]|nr:MAG: hypothetical protein CM15mP120_15690 [Pseudomonadota bacterium]
MGRLLNYSLRTIGTALCVTFAATAIPRRQPYKKKTIYWGDLHTHTAFSMDAYVLNTQTTPEDAYRFAQGALSPYPTAAPINCNAHWTLLRLPITPNTLVL